MKRNELEKSLQQNKMPCHLSLFISNILHANILSFATKMRRKTETAHRQKLSTYRETACKVTKTYTKQKKDIFQKGARKKDNKK